MPININFDLNEIISEQKEKSELCHIDEMQNTIVKFSGTNYSFYYLQDEDFYYTNKHNMNLKIVFSHNILLTELYFIATIYILNSKSDCNRYRCNRGNICKNKKHYYYNGDIDKKIILQSVNIEEMMSELTYKLSDLKTCEECLKVWDAKSNKMSINDEENTNICMNCNFKKHFNDKTMDNLGICSICLKTMYNIDSEKTHCNHLFHSDCIERWMEMNNRCPLCRSRLG
jgi:hypothetical protein